MRNIRCFIWRVAAAAVAVSYLIVRALSMHVDQSSTHFVAQIFHLHNHGLYLATDYNSTSWISSDGTQKWHNGKLHSMMIHWPDLWFSILICVFTLSDYESFLLSVLLLLLFKSCLKWYSPGDIVKLMKYPLHWMRMMF